MHARYDKNKKVTWSKKTNRQKPENTIDKNNYGSMNAHESKLKIVNTLCR